MSTVNQTEWQDSGIPAVGTETSTDLLGMLWRRKWIILFLTLLALPLGYIYYSKQPPVYQSTAQLLLIKQESQGQLPLAGVSGQVNYEDALATHMTLIRSPKIVTQAVEKYKLKDLPSLRDTDKPVNRIIMGLTAARAGGRELQDPNVIHLSYEGPNREDCAKILESVVLAYQDFLGETYKDFSQETVQLITQAKDVLQQQLGEKEAEFRKLRETAPVLLRGENGETISLHARRMAEIESARSQLMVNIAKTKARIEAIERALADNANIKALELLVERPIATKTAQAEQTGAAQPHPIFRDPLEGQLFEAMLEEQQLLEDYGPDHPKVVAARKRMSLIQEKIEANRILHQERLDAEKLLAEEQSVEPVDDGLLPPEQVVPTYVESLRQELKIDEKRLAEYNTLFDIERQAEKEIAVYQAAEEVQLADLSRTRQFFDTVVKRLEEINLAGSSSRVSAQLIAPPMLGLQVAPKLLNVLVFFGIGGCVLGWGLAYLIERADTNFRDPDDVRKHLGLPIVGHIPIIEVKKQKRKAVAAANGMVLAPSLAAYHQSRSRTAEAYRAVRTSLYFNSRGGTRKVIQVTSPEPGDGKTTLAGNLAVSIANSGKSVLLIDADFRRPRVHQLFGLQEDTPGIVSVINGDTEMADSIYRTPVPNLFVMPCGERPHNPAELLTSPTFEHLIEINRMHYDYVIIDTPPVLAVTDAGVIAPRVDGVLLVISLTKRARENATRARDTLTALGAEILGVVVNRFQQSQGYSRYRHGYGYGYGYGNHSYYSDDDSTPVSKPKPVALAVNGAATAVGK